MFVKTLKPGQVITKEKKETEEMDSPNLPLIEEIRDPRPLHVAACWCPGIGQVVVETTQFPITIGKLC